MASKKLGRFVFKIFGVLAFCSVSAYAVFLAYGYNLDIKGRQIEKTSIIDLEGRYPELRVFMNDRLIGNSLPLQVKDLLPGFYDLMVKKSGFLPWSRTLEVKTDLVTKVDDLVLIPEVIDSLQQQLSRFPDESRYFFGEDFLIVLSPKTDYLTLVYLLQQGTMKEQELKIHRNDIKDIHIYPQQKFLITFNDGTYEWVEASGPRFVDFSLPKGFYGLTILPEQNVAYILKEKNLYRVPIDKLSSLTVKNLADLLLVENVDQFDVHDGKLVYISDSLVYVADDQGKRSRLIDNTKSIAYIRFQPLAKVYIVKSSEGKRLLYAAENGSLSTLLTPQLKGDIYEDSAGNVLFSDESGNIFQYKPLLKKKILVTTLPPKFSLIGQLFDDGHFLMIQEGKVVLADSSYSNVYPLFAVDKNVHYFLSSGAIFTLNQIDQKLKSLFLLPR